MDELEITVLVAGVFLILLLCIVCYKSNKNFQEKVDSCQNAGGQPIIEHNSYAFCIKKDSVLEVK